MKIEVLCVVSPHGRTFAELLRKTGELLKSGQHDIEWKCIIDKGHSVPGGFACVHEQLPVKSRVRNHASALNMGAKFFNSDCIAFIDADIAILYQGWDEVLVQKLQTYDSFGVSHKRDYFRYHNYPVCQFMSFSQNVMREIDWDFSPQKKGRQLAKYVATEKDAEICDVPVGTVLKKDTAWYVPYAMHQHGFTKSFVMDLVSMVSGKSLMPYSSKKQKKFCYKIGSASIISGTSRMAEYHYHKDIYCTHFGRSRKVKSKNKEQDIWQERIAAYLQQRYGVDL